MWLIKHGRRPAVAKRTMSTKKVPCALLCACDSIAVQGPMSKGKSVTGRYYRDVVPRKAKNILREMMSRDRISTCLSIAWYAHSTYIWNCKAFSKVRQSNLPNWKKKFLYGQRYSSRLWAQPSASASESAYCKAFRTWIHILKLCISNHVEYFECI